MNMVMDITHRYRTEQAMNMVMDTSHWMHLLLTGSVDTCLLDLWTDFLDNSDSDILDDNGNDFLHDTDSEFTDDTDSDFLGDSDFRGGTEWLSQ